MKFFDRYKLSLHNIKNNKSRSILTTIIVFVISILMIFILSIAISFSKNYNEIVMTYFQKSGEDITIEYYGYGENDTYHLDLTEYEKIKNVINEHEETISYSKYEVENYYEVGFQNHRFAKTNDIEIVEGTNATREHENTSKVLISTDFVQQYYETNNIVLKPNSTFEYVVSYDRGNDEYGNSLLKEYKLNLEVIGIFKHLNVENDFFYYGQTNDIIMDIEYFLSTVEEAYISSFVYHYLATNTNFNKEEFVNNLQAVTDKLNDIIPKRGSYESVNSVALSDIKLSNLLSVIIIVLASFLCLILILLSIGSLANTIMISVDKNKKFIGLLKALGLNERDLKSVIKMESITTIVFGVILAFIALYVFKEQVAYLNELLISSMFSFYLVDIDYKITFDFYIYVPIIVLIFFIVFTLLFARSSMSKIGKLDPMAVISEVS